MHRGYYDQPPLTTPKSKIPRFPVWIYVLAFLLILAVIVCGVLLGQMIYQGPSLSSSTGSTQSTPSLQEGDEASEENSDGTTSAALEETSDTSVARAPTGDGTVLTISPSDGEALSYQEIYTKNIDAIVSIQGLSDVAISSGTGVIFTENGYIVTNAHVIQDCYSLEVTLYDERTYDALLVGMDTISDIAVLKIDDTDLTYAQFGDSDLVEAGDVALALGNPLGYELMGTMTDGIISAINRDVSLDGFTMSYIQTSAALNSGNSGGALLNDQGQVIGITTLKMMSTSDTIEGLGFAIPSVTVKEVVDELIAYGNLVGNPTIGITVNTYPVTFDGGQSGLMVIEVLEGSDALTQGLLVGDVIAEVNGIPIDSMETLSALKETLGVGGIMECYIFRDGEYLTISFALIEQYTLYQ